MRHLNIRDTSQLGVIISAMLVPTLIFANTPNKLDIVKTKIKTPPVEEQVVKSMPTTNVDDYETFYIPKAKPVKTTTTVNKPELLKRLVGTELEKHIPTLHKYARNDEELYFMASVMALESGWGTSDIYIFKKNAFSYRAYDRDPYENAKAYNSVEESIIDFQALIDDYYNNHNLKTLDEIGTRYCSDGSWSKNVRSIMLKMIELDLKQ